MKPNLKPFNIGKLSFSTTCVIPEEILSNINIQDKDADSVSRFFNSYTIDRVSYLCVLTLQCKDAKTGEYFIEFEFSISKRKVKLPRGTPKIGTRVDMLCTLDKSHRFNCSTNIEFSKKDKRQFIIDLPIKLSETSNFPISLIDGFSVEGNVESIHYSALIWTQNKPGDYSVITVFPNDYTFNSSLIQCIIDDSTKIVNSIMPLQN